MNRFQPRKRGLKGFHLTSNYMTKFETECRKVSEATGIEVTFHPDKEKSDPVQDDGTLHITKRGLRACFDVGLGQGATGKYQNERTRAILSALKMEDCINDHVLVDEEDEDENVCPHCGEPI